MLSTGISSPNCLAVVCVFFYIFLIFFSSAGFLMLHPGLFDLFRHHFIFFFILLVVVAVACC